MKTLRHQAEALAPGEYGADDLLKGDQILTGTRTVSAEMIDAYAGLSGDHFEIHMDSEAARKHGFENRVAHGIMVLGLADGLKNQAPAQVRARASLGWEIRFTAPVLAGDSISATLVIDDIRPTRSGNQSVLRLTIRVENQHNDTVLEGSNMLLAYR